jgi:hypothetical protein
VTDPDDSICRFATLITQHNIELYNAMASFGLFIKPSSLSDTLLYAMLTQPAPGNSSGSFESYADWFIQTNQQRMGEAYRYMRDRLESLGLEVFPSSSGHFIWTRVADDAKWGSWDEELAGFERIFDAGVYIVSRRRMSLCLVPSLDRQRFRLPVLCSTLRNRDTFVSRLRSPNRWQSSDWTGSKRR